MDASTFVANLDNVDLSNVASQEQQCSICKGPFRQALERGSQPRYQLRSLAATAPDEHSEEAVRLPCNHVFGRECIRSWLTGNNSCPMCRARVITNLDNRVVHNLDDRVIHDLDDYPRLMPNGNSFAEDLNYLRKFFAGSTEVDQAMPSQSEISNSPNYLRRFFAVPVEVDHPFPSQNEISNNPVLNRIKDGLTRAIDDPNMLRGFRQSVLHAYRRWDLSEWLHGDLWDFWVSALPEEVAAPLHALPLPEDITVPMDQATQDILDPLENIFGPTLLNLILFW